MKPVVLVALASLVLRLGAAEGPKKWKPISTKMSNQPSVDKMAREEKLAFLNEMHIGSDSRRAHMEKRELRAKGTIDHCASRAMTH